MALSRPLVVIPAYSHVDHRLQRVLRRVGLPVLELYGCSDLVKARSGLLSDALATDADRFLFIDADMNPTPEQLVQLAESPRLDSVNAVSGCYLMADGKLAAAAESGEVTVMGEKRFAPLLVAGMGFAAAHRDTVERVAKELPKLKDATGRMWYPFFLPVVVSQQIDGQEERQYLPEDYSFWWRLRMSGISSWIDTHLPVAHLKHQALLPATGHTYSPPTGVL